MDKTVSEQICRQIRWEVKSFDNLTAAELYQVLRLRSQVFVVEQQSLFLDMDNRDQVCDHLMGWLPDGRLAASTRLVPPGVTYPEASVGRVVTAPEVRKGGVGKELMERSLHELRLRFGEVPVRIGAQVYLTRFYESFGFVTAGAVYIEDGIAHVEMLRRG